MTRPAWLEQGWLSLQPLRQRGVHALLLHGAAGIGKKSLALDLAAALLCESPRGDGAPCGACASCALHAAGNHPDLRVVVPDVLATLRPGSGEAESSADDEGEGDTEISDAKGKRISREIKIGPIRALSDFMNVATHRAGARVVMLAPAEALNAPAANALLKMLEEPGPGSVFLLVSDALDEVLPTIRSRCVLVRICGPSWGDALQWLRTQDIEDAEALLAAAGGAPLAALEAARGEGGLDRETRALLLSLLAQGAGLSPAEVAARSPRTIDVGAAIALFQRWGWDLLAHRSAGVVRYHRDERRAIAKLADRADPAALLRWCGELNRLRASADHPLNARLVIEAALLAYASALRH
jgi:DNA polymerase-3 subunit delta'